MNKGTFARRDVLKLWPPRARWACPLRARSGPAPLMQPPPPSMIRPPGSTLPSPKSSFGETPPAGC